MDKRGLKTPKFNLEPNFPANVNRAKLPEVQYNLNELKRAIESEASKLNDKGDLKIDMDNFYFVKREYVEAIQSYGVDTKLIKENANEYLKALVDAEKNPIKKMNLQLLASKTKKQINEITKPKPYHIYNPEPNPLTNPLLNKGYTPNAHNYITKEKEALSELGMDTSNVLSNRIKKYLKNNVGINKNNNKTFKLKNSKDELKQKSLFDTILDRNKNVIDKNTGEVIYNNKNKQQFYGENHDNELLKNYYSNKNKADKIKEFFSTVSDRLKNGGHLSDMEFSTFLDSIGFKHDIGRPSSFRTAINDFKDYLFKQVEEGNVDYDEVSSMFLPDNYKPWEHTPKPNKPNTPLDNIPTPKPNTPNKPLDDIPVPNNKPNTPLDDVPTPNKPKPKPNKPVDDSPKPNTNNKPNEPKPNTNTSTNTHQNKTRKLDIDFKNNPVWDLYKRYLNTYKKGVTVYNPGWHLANFLQNKGQNYLALGTDAFKKQTDASKMLDYIRGITDDVADVKLSDGTVLRGKDVAKHIIDNGIAEGAQSSTILNEPKTLLPWLDKRIDDTKLMDKLSRNEETARIHHYLTQIKRGMSPDDAVKSVNKYLFDYGNKSKSEKFMENFIDPFYVFHKNYVKLLGSEALTNPSKLNNILRMEREMTNAVPEDERNQNASESKFQLPFGSFTDSKNKDRYDYMYKQFMFPEIQNALPLEYKDLEGKMNPLLKLAIQQARGRGDFDTKVVDKKKAGFNEVTKADRKKEIALDVNPFVNNLFTTINKVDKVNNRKQSKETSDLQKLELIFNYLTGNKGKHERYLEFLK